MDLLSGSLLIQYERSVQRTKQSPSWMCIGASTPSTDSQNDPFKATPRATLRVDWSSSRHAQGPPIRNCPVTSSLTSTSEQTSDSGSIKRSPYSYESITK